MFIITQFTHIQEVSYQLFLNQTQIMNANVLRKFMIQVLNWMEKNVKCVKSHQVTSYFQQKKKQ
ncbi:Oligopeptide transport ATP-binding protein [Streptococcus parauberis KRS-02109]|uniref:Transposase n=1 Tax=Streptococcus parauberis KRS-02083 TaxID=1207545 RepID=A0ABN0IQE8_9STRE|nr:Oligopeptide transport ATP-binding protein [Streptococcus parauberis KRS-02109]EMG25091.1 hypothetical protein SPJ1_1539 [Streptococcus parauberis KRS-02083]